ncbi:hypothetical protein BRC91_06535 [Halobacteriales archaeon QS_4_62_28]|nr:MAG: hypothetical protein BRC91_06535 [Halobacteriales archaeon QS_4_62_28]
MGRRRHVSAKKPSLADLTASVSVVAVWTNQWVGRPLRVVAKGDMGDRQRDPRTTAQDLYEISEWEGRSRLD